MELINGENSPSRNGTYGPSPCSDITGGLEVKSLTNHLLSNQLRQIFSTTPHPMLNASTSRALSRPAGGPDAQGDFHDTAAQAFKAPSAWGGYNVLAWCASQLPPEEMEHRIGVILPPTLVLMDDWEPPWRGRGVRVLRQWMDKIPTETMKRMGVDKLLVNSLIQTLSIHANPPLEGAFEATLQLVNRTTKGKERADRIAEIMDKAILQGWMYAVSGKEGRQVLIEVARQLELMCKEIKAGIVRWLKVSLVISKRSRPDAR